MGDNQKYTTIKTRTLCTACGNDCGEHLITVGENIILCFTCIDKTKEKVDLYRKEIAEFGFYLDAAADKDNALCSYYLTEKDDSLNCDWESYGAIFLNPPYSEIQPWINKSDEQCKKQLQPIVMLIPADTSVGWFNSALDS